MTKLQKEYIKAWRRWRDAGFPEHGRLIDATQKAENAILVKHGQRGPWGMIVASETAKGKHW